MAHPSRLTVTSTRRVLRGLLAAASLPLLLAACGTSTTAPTTTTKVSVPGGWKTYTFAKVAIAVPRSWAVKHDTTCPNADAPGTLLLGVPPVLINCAAFEYPATVVTVSQLSTTTDSTSVPVDLKPTTINGIPVYVGFGSLTSLYWTVPSLDVHVIGMGPDASRVLHTIYPS